MEPIISPWFIYFAEMCDGLKILSILLLVASVVGNLYFGGSILESYWTSNWWKSEDEKKTHTKMFKICIVVTIISALGMVLVPSTDTVYKMIIFNNITTNNIEKGKDYVEDIIDYTADKLIEIKEGED